jgi:hypothetical protein
MNKLVFFNSGIDVFSTFLVFLIGAIIIISITGLFNASRVRVFGLYIWHTIFSIVYAYISTLIVYAKKLVVVELLIILAWKK